MDEGDGLRVRLMGASILMVRQGMEAIDCPASGLARSLVPFNHGQTDVTQRLNHDDACGILHQGEI